MKHDYAFVVSSYPFPVLLLFYFHFDLCSLLCPKAASIIYMGEFNYAVRFLCYFRSLFLTYFEQEFRDPRDADDARYNLDGRDIDGSRLIVEFAKGVGINFRLYLLHLFFCYMSLL